MDGSQFTKKLVLQAIELVRSQDDHITVLTVEAPKPEGEEGALVAQNSHSHLLDLFKAEKHDRWDVLTKEGDPRRVICDIASGDYDYVVIGSRGHGDLNLLPLGSVAEYVIRYAPTTVVCVK